MSNRRLFLGIGRVMPVLLLGAAAFGFLSDYEALREYLWEERNGPGYIAATDGILTLEPVAGHVALTTNFNVDHKMRCDCSTNTVADDDSDELAAKVLGRPNSGSSVAMYIWRCGRSAPGRA